jgi:anti-sigma factor RsiW
METEDDLKTSLHIKRDLSRHAAPDALRQKILQDMAAHQPGHPAIGWRQRFKKWFVTSEKKWALLPTGFAVGVLTTFVGMQLFVLPPQDMLTQDIASSHVRSLMADHLSDVASTDKHTVKPWFIGKLDYAPPVNDFATHGFALQGGRIDYLDQRAVAALVYQRKAHVINAYVWPDTQTDTSPKSYARKGFNMLRWRSAGMAYWLVSDISTDELLELSKIIRLETAKKITTAD